MSWTWWMTLLVIFGVLFLIGCIPVGIDAVQDEAGLRLDAKIWLFRIGILPEKPKKKKKEKPKTEKPAAVQPAQSAGAKKEPGTSALGSLKRIGIDNIFELLDTLLDLLGDFRRKLRVKELTLHVSFDGSDPARAAICYGGAWAFIGALTPILEQAFVIKKRDISPILDYNNRETELTGRLQMTISVGRLLCMGLRLLKKIGVSALRKRQKNKIETNTNKGGADQ